MTALLSVDDLSAGYDGTIVVRNLSLDVEGGQTAVVIGPNGHGKTTLLRAVTGLIRPRGGTVTLAGRRIERWPAEEIAKLGVVHVMQGDGLFADMTVEENLLMGAFPAASWRSRRGTLQRVYERFPIVQARRDKKARTLSGGERRLVGLGRGLMRPAQLLLIDEPSLGLAPLAIDAVYDAIREIRQAGTPMVLVEENFSHIVGIADVVHVLESGVIVKSGSYAALSKDRTVVETYLGSPVVDAP